MANRMQRRAMAAAQRQSLVREYRTGSQVAGMIKHGILPEDLQKKFDEGRAYGFMEASMPMFKTCTAAVCLMLHEEFGMNEDDVFRGASAVGNKILYCLENQELVDDVLEKTGIEIRMDDVLEPVQRTE